MGVKMQAGIRFPTKIEFWVHMALRDVVWDLKNSADELVLSACYRIKSPVSL